ncbi:MAG: QueT transporter family protein [Clostridia bacterium]
MSHLTKICISGVIAALYASMTIVLAPISYGVIQLRIAECFAILPSLMPFATLGVTVGCLISNVYFSVMGVYDIIFGTLITLIAGICTAEIKNMWLAPIPPIVLNAVGLPLIWLLSGVDAFYWLNCLSIFISQAIILYGVGIPLYLLTKRNIIPLLLNNSAD